VAIVNTRVVLVNLGLTFQFILMASFSGSRDSAAASSTGRKTTSSKEELAPTVLPPTTLSTHFFGHNGDRRLTIEEFSAFIRGLQREVLRAEVETIIPTPFRVN
jgi:hypothetical protein